MLIIPASRRKQESKQGHVQVPTCPYRIPLRLTPLPLRPPVQTCSTRGSCCHRVLHALSGSFAPAHHHHHHHATGSRSRPSGEESSENPNVHGTVEMTRPLQASAFNAPSARARPKIFFLLLLLLLLRKRARWCSDRAKLHNIPPTSPTARRTERRARRHAHRCYDTFPTSILVVSALACKKCVLFIPREKQGGGGVIFSLPPSSTTVLSGNFLLLT